MRTAWKFLNMNNGTIVSKFDGSQWEIGTWRINNPPKQLCNGFNCSKLVKDALGYVNGTVFAKVEYDGKSIKSSDKITVEKMRIVKAWKWDQAASVKMAIFSARMVLGIFEKKYPYDKRPRKAIESAEAWIKNPSASASAAYAAANAYAAAYASADNSAAAAYSYAAANAANAANAAEIKGKKRLTTQAAINRYVTKKLILELEEIK